MKVLSNTSSPMLSLAVQGISQSGTSPLGFSDDNSLDTSHWHLGYLLTPCATRPHSRFSHLYYNWLCMGESPCHSVTCYAIKLVEVMEVIHQEMTAALQISSSMSTEDSHWHFSSHFLLVLKPYLSLSPFLVKKTVDAVWHPCGWNARQNNTRGLLM